MESLDTPLHNPDYAEISINSKSEIIPEVETDSGDKSDVEDKSKKPRKFLGSTLEEVANVPKVKLKISSAPLPPVQEFPELPYGRRKKRRPGEENQENWIKVPLILSAKRIHPGTKQNNLLLEPLTEIKDQIEETDEKPNIDKVPKYRRKRRTVTAVTNDLQTTETTNNDIFSAPNESHDDTILDNLTKVFDDNDDGFTTIKDLAERGITKMEPLDYGDDPYLDECYNEEFAGFEEENQSNFKHESGDQEQSQFDLDHVKNEPDIESKEKSAEKDGGDVDSIKSEPKESRNRKCKTKLRQSKQTISDDDVFNNEDLDDILFRHQDDEVLDVEDRPLKPPKKAKRKPRSKPAPGYGPAPDRKVYNCKYCEYNGKKLEWLAHLKSAHSDKNLVFCKLKKCQQPFESPELLDEHEKNTHIKNVCTFEGCGKEFKFKSVLREHRKTHFPADCDWMVDPDPEMTLDRFFVCTFCGRR